MTRVAAVCTITSSIVVFGFLLSESLIPSYQIREIIGAVAAILMLICGAIVFTYIGLRCLAVILAPEPVTAYFAEFISATETRWIKYHYRYNGKQYTGVGRAIGIHETIAPHTAFPLHISRINPNLSWNGNPYAGILAPALFLLTSLLVAIYFAAIVPQWRNFAYDIHWRSHKVDVHATGMTSPFVADAASSWQHATLHIENNSHVTVVVNELKQTGETISSRTLPPGVQDQLQASSGTQWSLRSGTQVIGGFASTPQAGYVNIRDAQ